MNDPVHHPSHYDGPPCPGCGRPIEYLDFEIERLKKES